MQKLRRYDKQIRFKPIGKQGQKRLLKSRVGILGAGALGSNIANLLGRAGVGQLVIADYDKVELSNLQRQMIFRENDIGKLKSPTLASHLKNINSKIDIEAFSIKINSQNFTDIFANCDLIFDATDNFSTRFLINKECLALNIPWVHSGVTGASGQSMLIVPGKTACLSCLIPDNQVGENFPDINSEGILAQTVTIIASISTISGIRFLIEKYYDSSLRYFDAWNHEFKKFHISISQFCNDCREQKIRRK
ncbi:MAG: HesA/MoeB/ThiF family protein [Candidatus Rifleibacteriota bacterium]